MLALLDVISIDVLAFQLTEYIDEHCLLSLCTVSNGFQTAVLKNTHWRSRIKRVVSMKQPFDSDNFLYGETPFALRRTFVQHLCNRDSWQQSAFFESACQFSRQHPQGINCIAVNPILGDHLDTGYVLNRSDRPGLLMGEPMLASGCMGGVILLWPCDDQYGNNGNNETQEPIPPVGCLTGDSEPITRVIWNNKSQLLSSSYGGSIKLWDISIGSPCRTIGHSEAPLRSFSSHNDRVLAMASWDNIVMAGYRDGCLSVFDVRASDSSPISRHYYGDRSIYSLDVDQEKGVCWMGNHNGYVTAHDIRRCMVPSPSTQSLSGAVERERDSSLLFKRQVHTRPVMTLARAQYPSRRTSAGNTFHRLELMASGCRDGKLSLFTTSFDTKPDTCLMHSQLAPDLIGASEVDSLSDINSVDAHSSGVRSLSFSPYRNVLISSGNDGSIQSWYLDQSSKSVPILTHKSTFGGHSAQVPQVVCCGQSIFSCSIDTTIKEHMMNWTDS